MRNDQSPKEILSALADGELGSNIAENEIIERACKDQDVMSAWHSMHLVRDVLQAEYNSTLPADFSQRVKESIAQEGAFEAQTASVVSLADARGRVGQRQRSTRTTQSTQQPFAIWKPVAGFGLAASLAGVTFLFSQLWQTEQPDTTQIAEAALQQADPSALASVQQKAAQENSVDGLTLQAAVRIGNDGTRWRMADNEVPRNDEIEKRLNTLLTNHLEDASMGSVHGLVSHSRVVGYDSMPVEPAEK